MSSLSEDADGRQMLAFDHKGRGYAVQLSADGKWLTVSQAGVIFTVPIPSAAVWEKLAQAAKRAAELAQAQELAKAVSLDYRDAVGGATK